jgi:hypothetical protein
MRFRVSSFTLLPIFITALTLAQQAHAETSVFSDNGDSTIYSQLLTISAGPLEPKSAVISNGSYAFNYGQAAQKSFLIEAGWSARLFWLFGGFYLNENFAYSQLSGSPNSNAIGGANDTTLTANLFGFDTRLTYAAEWFPVHWIIPFAEGGYQYTFYNQSGSVDLDSASGGVGNMVAGAGLRFWLNRTNSQPTDTVHNHQALPIFLSFKWNRIFSNNADSLNLADSSYQGGISLGL